MIESPFLHCCSALKPYPSVFQTGPFLLQINKSLVSTRRDSEDGFVAPFTWPTVLGPRTLFLLQGGYLDKAGFLNLRVVLAKVG